MSGQGRVRSLRLLQERLMEERKTLLKSIQPTEKCCAITTSNDKRSGKNKEVKFTYLSKTGILHLVVKGSSTFGHGFYTKEGYL